MRKSMNGRTIHRGMVLSSIDSTITYCWGADDGGVVRAIRSRAQNR